MQALPIVETTVVRRGIYHRTIDLPGNVLPLKQIPIITRVSGFLTARPFTEGQRVNAGDVLYKIDDRSYRIAVTEAEAELLNAKATALNAKQEFARIEKLYAEKIASQENYEAAMANRDSTQAKVLSAGAALDNAKLNLSYTVITAPFSGLTALTKADVGEYVTPPETLTELRHTDMVRVEFQVSDRTLDQEKDLPEWQVTLEYPDGEEYPLSGRIVWRENSISTSTATMTMQSEIANPENRLISGQYVRVRLTDPVAEQVLLLDSRAIRFIQGRALVFIVDKNDQLILRLPELGETVGNDRIVRNGLFEGDRVIISGNPYLRAGQKVNLITEGKKP